MHFNEESQTTFNNPKGTTLSRERAVKFRFILKRLIDVMQTELVYFVFLEKKWSFKFLLWNKGMYISLKYPST